MSTSLKEQLQKLAVPQTTALLDRKRRASILFDTKEAATKDRRTIYELGISGLQELISLNADFKQFELTLFDETAIELERAVEQSEVNELLNRNIRKFLQHLSPYFLLRPAHLCLEWLLRRFEVHNYNRDDLLALSLPYHETNIFVRVLQTLYVGDAEWEWLRPLRRPGLPLPKSAIINRASSHAGFLAFICRSTLNILREFGARSHLLQTQINFFTTVVVGAFETTTAFKEWHISTVLESLLYALSAKVLDVAAAGYIIAAQLVARTQLKIKLCNALLERVIAVSFEELRPSAVMLIILIFDVQESAPTTFSQKALNTILGQKWLIPVIVALAKQQIEIYPLCAPLLRDAASAIESGHEDAETFKRLADQLLNDLDFTHSTACRMINCFLDCYVQEAAAAQQKPSLEDDDVIDLDSDDEEIDTAKPAYKSWYSDYLRRLEKKYPNAFDETIKAALSSKTEGSDNRKMALKIALGYRLKVSNANTTDIYESLYHHNANIRQLAVHTLLSNLSNYQTRFQNLELLKTCLADRLVDDSRSVVAELLKLPSKDFIEALGHEQFATGLLTILHKIQTRNNWTKLTPPVVRHLTSSQLLANYDVNLILLALMPLLFPSENNDAYNLGVEEMLKSDLVKRFPFLKQLRANQSAAQNPSDARKCFLNLFADDKNAKHMPSPNELFESVKKQGEGYLKQAAQLSNFLILLTVSFRSEQSAAESLHMFEAVMDYVKMFQLKQMDTLQKANWEEVISLQLFTDFLQALVRYTSFENLDTWYMLPTAEHVNLTFFLRVFEVVAGNVFSSTKTEEMGTWSNTLIQCMEAVSPLTQQKIDLLTNFYLDTDMGNIKDCTPSVRLMAFKVLNSLLGSKKDDYELNLTHILKISSALVSAHEPIRKVSLETLALIDKNTSNLDNNLKYFVKSILEYTPEISMDKEQYPLMLYVILKSPNKRVDQTKAARLLRDILQLLNNPDPTRDDIVFQAQLLNTLQHFNDEEILAALIPLAIQSLKHVTPELSGAPALLPAPHNRVFHSIIQRFQAQTIEQVVTECSETWKLFESIFEKFNVYMSVENRELQPLPCILLDTLDMHIYDKLPTKYRFELMKLILRTEALAQNDIISISAHKLLKNCLVDCKPLVVILQQMYTGSGDCQKTPGKKTPINKQGKRKSDAGQQKLAVETNSLVWKEGVALLEILEHKEKIENAEQLIPTLFDLLKYSLELDEQAGSGDEYTKQLTLSTLLHCCRYAKSHNINLQQAFPKATFRIDQIVQCVRATQNPQTHQNALTLLAHCAAQFPQQVLHNIVDIFTFMGSSVVRHDDAFSFHIIDNIIQSIIPILVQTGQAANTQHAVIPVLKVFSDIMLDVPEHRRISLYTKLLNTLGVGEHFWLFLCTVFEAQVAEEEKQRQVQKQTKSDQSATAEKQTKRMEIVLALSNTFAPELVLETCTQLLVYLKNILPLTKEHESLSDLEGDSSTATKPKLKSVSKSSADTEIEIFSVQHHSSIQLRHYKYIIMQYLSSVSKTPEFLRKIAVLNDAEMLELKPYFQNFIISILAYMPIVNAAVERFDKPVHVKFWKVILHHLHDVLDNGISLLSPDMFLVVIIGLIEHQLLSVRKKVIELLITKLQKLDEESNFLASFTEQRFTELIAPLSDIIAGILTKQQQQDEPVSPASPSTSSGNELIFLQQTTLIAVKLLSKHFALQYIGNFKSVLANLTKIVKCRGNIPKIVFATVVLALIEISSNLKAHSLEQLPKFMPQLIELLNHQADAVRQQPPDHVCIAIITGTQKLFESLPRFLGPYIVDIITALSSISTRIAAQQSKKDQRSIVALNKISLIWTKIAAEVYIRILVPSCEKSYKNLMANECYDEIKEVMKLLRESVERATNEDLAPVQTELRTFFLHVLEFRMEVKQKEVVERERVTAIELTIIDAFVAYVLKLSESAFRPLYEKVYDWAIKQVAQPETQLTYFLVSSRVGGALKSLFLLFAGKFLEDAGNLLNTCNTSKHTINHGDDEYIQLELLKAILSTLHNVFIHANKKFINIQRFEMLLPKIVDQVENRLVLENEDVQEQLIACIAQLAVVVSNDLMWKQVNYQVLLKTRTNVPEVRILSFNCCVEIARKLGDEFTSLLPETVPFIAELFEDENSRVEKNTRRAVQELESILGESLQKYL